MRHLAPHLLLRTDSGPSRAAMLLGAAGYVVSKIDDDALIERIAGASHIDGVVIERPTLAAIQLGKRLQERWGTGALVTLIITSGASSVRIALPEVPVLTPREIGDNLISTIDLAIARRAQPLSPDRRESLPSQQIRVA